MANQPRRGGAGGVPSVKKESGRCSMALQRETIMNDHRGIAVALFHSDHSVSDAHLSWALDQVAAEGVQGFFLRTFTLPENLSDLTCGLHGPTMGDAAVPESECEMVQRGERPNLSRLCNRPARNDRRISIIGIRDESGWQVFTTFGGPCAEREVGDPSLAADPAAFAASESFWAVHALSR